MYIGIHFMVVYIVMLKLINIQMSLVKSLGLVQANASDLWHVHCNGLLEKQKSERQKTILEVPTQYFEIWCKNMKRGQSDYLSEYITFSYGN